LRAVFDMVDAVKAWETDRRLEGAALFEQTCEALDKAQPAGDAPAYRLANRANDSVNTS